MSATQLDQQESFVLHGPQLEVLGEIESKLPAPARKRPAANIVLGAAIVLAVFGIGGGRLKAQQNAVLRQYTATNQYNQGIQNDLAAQANAAASLVRQAQKVLGESNDAVAEVQAVVDRLQQPPKDPADAHAVNQALYSAVDGLYQTARSHAGGETLDRIEELYAEFVSRQATIDRAAGAYNTAARDYNAMAGSFPANLVGALWGAGSVPEFSA